MIRGYGNKPLVGLVAEVVSSRIDSHAGEPETTWLAEGVMLPNGTSVIVPKEGIRGVPGVLPLPPAPHGMTMQTSKIQMRRQRLIDGKKMLVATIPQENPKGEFVDGMPACEKHASPLGPRDQKRLRM